MSFQKAIQVPKTARYNLSQEPNDTYDRVCFALHGYGQLAPYFIKNFEHPELNKILFVAPEGLHRFYLQNSAGRVGASWMTKEERLTDIEDYSGYLDLVYQDIEQHISPNAKVGILGFSQGVATACRWLSFSKLKFDFLVNWAGAFPPDLPHELAISRMQKIKVHMLLGDQDEYATIPEWEKHVAELKEKGFEVKKSTFDGQHKIYKEPLLQVFEQLNLL